MNHRELLLYWSILGFEASLCVLVYARGLRKYLPFFSGYSGTLLVCSVGFGLTYHHYGFRSLATYYAAWTTAAADLIARTLAVAELCRYRLRPYRGIWALSWRLLAVLSVLLFAHAAVDAWGQPDWIATYGLTIELDIGISSIVILSTLLLIRNYYGLTFDPLQKAITFGLLFFCIVEVVNNTMLRGLFTSYILSWSSVGVQVERANEWWNTVRFSAFIVSMGVWCFALRKPLPAPAPEPALLPAEVYATLSPEVNMRLRAFNDRLLEMLKP